MARTSSNFFALGTNGIAVYGAGLFRMLAFEQPKMACTVTALVEAPNHDIWINGSRGIIRIPTGEMQHALSPARHKIYAEEVHEGDFVGPATYWKPTPSANVDTEGTLWFSTLNGVV